MAVSNNKISNLISSQVPFFVRDDHTTFVRFLEAYYEFLEQEDQVVNSIKQVNTYYDVDLTIDDFSAYLYKTFLKLIPEDVIVDKDLILKNIKDFYRARGTEKAARFFMRALFGEEIDFYYPKKDILKASDGKWYIQKSLRVNDTMVESVADDSLTALEHFIGIQIRGSSSNTTALVERVDRFYEQGTLIDELVISNIDGTFENGETVSGSWNDVESVKSISANIFSGILNTITIVNGGTGYSVGNPVILLSNTGSGACAYIAQVSTGNISALSIYQSMSGAGYQNTDNVVAFGGGGSGFSGYVSFVDTSEQFHPNTYNLVFSSISLEANTLIGNGKYSNLNSSLTDPANNWMANSMSYWDYTNTGPVLILTIGSAGSGYTSEPSLSVSANSRIKALGILGRMEIYDGGSGYAKGNKIEFLNVLGGYGSGASGNVKNVDGSGTITEVEFEEVPGHVTGGSGFNQLLLPVANVISSTGTGANIGVTAILGSGAVLQTANSSIGAIERIIITSRGTNYEDATVDLTGSGDGNANANASIITGVYVYPGRFLNDDGMLSSYNFLENRDYYQNFSYVIKIKKDINKYRSAAMALIHPAGMKMFGEYTSVDQLESFEPGSDTAAANRYKYTTHTYTKINGATSSSNTINISYTSHGLSKNANVYLEFRSGGYNNVANGIYLVTNSTNTNHFLVIQPTSTPNATSGSVDVGVELT